MEKTIVTILAALWFCLVPAAVMKLCGKSRLLRKIGPVLILYFIGIVTGNIGIPSEKLKPVQDILSSATVPLSIPLMLFGCKFRKENTRSQLLALITGLVAVVAAVTAGYFIFGKHLEDGAATGGMLTGVYTGGTINLAAIKAMLGASDETYILINSYDMIVSFLYLTFLMTVGIGLFRKLLPYSTSVNISGETDFGEIPGQDNNRRKFNWKEAAVLTGLTLAICAAAGGLALLLPESSFMVGFILGLTTLGIICSFNRKIREMKQGYDIGMYLIYIFCITVASMADFSKLDISGSLNLLGYLLFAVFGSLFIQAVLARIFRIDADTMVIASVSYINSPPFVPMMAAVMKNRDIIPAGLSIGIIGYAVGNYLGFIIYSFLSTLTV